MAPFRSIFWCCAFFMFASCDSHGNQDAANTAADNEAAQTSGPSNAAEPPARPAVDPNEKRMVIEALPAVQSGPGSIMGSFHMIRSASGIETDGIGGGCLAFEDPASKVCRADSDCKLPSYIPAGNGPWAYCADSKCWVKPADKAFCWKSRYSSPAQPLQVGKPESTPKVTLASLPAQLFQGPAKNQVKARVIACLNGKYGAMDVPPCAGGDGKRSDDIGEVRTFSK
jgi:hypothetical protein